MRKKKKETATGLSIGFFWLLLFAFLSGFTLFKDIVRRKERTARSVILEEKTSAVRMGKRVITSLSQFSLPFPLKSAPPPPTPAIIVFPFPSIHCWPVCPKGKKRERKRTRLLGHCVSKLESTHKTN